MKTSCNTIITIKTTKIVDAIACLMVIASHFGSYLGVRLFAPLGAGGVSAFLIMSGYGLTISEKRNGLKNYWEKRVLRVLLPYWIVRIIAYFIGALFGTSITLKLLLYDLFLLNPLGPNCWYLQFAFIHYLIFWLIHKFLNNREYLHTVIYITIGILFFHYGTSLQAKQCFAFAIGVLIAKKDQIIVNIGRKPLFVTCFLCAVSVALLYIRHYVLNDSVLYISYFVHMLQNLSMAVLVIIFGITLSQHWNANVLIHVGVISYGNTAQKMSSAEAA